MAHAPFSVVTHFTASATVLTRLLSQDRPGPAHPARTRERLAEVGGRRAERRPGGRDVPIGASGGSAANEVAAHTGVLAEPPYSPVRSAWRSAALRRDAVRIGLVAPTMAILGGHAVQAARLLDGWRDDPEIQMRLLPINPPPPRGLRWVSRLRVVRTVVTQLRYWPSLLRSVRHVDVLHVFCTSNGSFFLSALPAILVARMYGKPVVANYRGDSQVHLASSPIARRLLGSVAANVVPSAYFGRIFRELGVPARIVPNVADVARFRFRVRDPFRPVLLSTRNFEPIYDVACTLRAFAVVQAAYADASLVLVGSGRDAGALRALARALGLRNVTFAGRVPHAAIPCFYDAADIYVQTPVVDNMPGSVIEAFASGLPVVATDVGGLPVILTHGMHGLLAPAGDHGAVAEQVLALLARPDEARRMAAAAFATCPRYAWSGVREQWRAVYRSVLSGRSAPGTAGRIA